MHTIRLNIPRGWNALNVSQLESVCRILIDESKKYTDTGVFDRDRLLTRCFFAISGLEVISLPMTDEDVPEDDPSSTEDDPSSTEESSYTPRFANEDTSSQHIYFNCQFSDDLTRRQRQSIDGKVAPIRIYLHEIISLAIGDITNEDVTSYLRRLERYDNRIAEGRDATIPEPPEPNGPLSWLLKPSTLTIFPYSELTIADKHDKHNRKVTFRGPSEMMQDFTWRQYRFSCDLISYLQRCENTLVSLQKRKAPADRIIQADSQVKQARAQFLSNLFSRPVEHIDRETGLKVNTPFYVSTQFSDNAYFFIDFPEHKFQAVSLWWQGMMHHMQQQFPKVFRSEKVGKSKTNDDPFSLYTRSTTTMIKYAASNEEEVNATTYTIILQHIQDMAEENDRIEAMKK